MDILRELVKVIISNQVGEIQKKEIKNEKAAWKL